MKICYLHKRINNISVSFIIFFVSLNIIAATSITVPSENCKTISQALIKAKKGDTVWVKEGIYKDQIKISSGVILISRSLFKAVIDGAGSETAVTMGNKSTLSGFEIKNARIGIYSEGTDNIITKCFIHDNQQSGIICVGHLPSILDNIIVENNGSGIQGWDVRSTISTINHNTIAYNSNHGISIGGKSDIVVENNIIAFNEKLGLKVEPDVKIKLIRNNFYFNAELVVKLPSDNYTFDPMFLAATSMNYMISKQSKCRNMASDSKNIGARLIY